MGVWDAKYQKYLNVGGTTTPKQGYFTRLRSDIRIPGGIKSFHIAEKGAKMIISHEFIHAYHYMAIGNGQLHTDNSERAAHSYSLAYGKAYNMNDVIEGSRIALNKLGRNYPFYYSWRDMRVSFPWINVGIK